MVGSRTLTALAGLLVSLAVSVAVYVYTGSLLLFLVVPFVPFLFSSSPRDEAGTHEKRPVKRCPSCDFRARDPEFDYCPRDGRRLREE
ncbi:hypothetical protein BRC88_11645 [Halobacteriales archaeon QS_4_69_225]|nr:MAG: hypothetical protein BRC88_11645 [Halobacteriales archaeon QS_4_69_225]